VSPRNLDCFLFHNVHPQLLDSSISSVDGLSSLGLSFSNILLIAFHDPLYSGESKLDFLGCLALPFTRLLLLVALPYRELAHSLLSD